MDAFAVPLTPWSVLVSVLLAVGYGLAVSMHAGRHARTGLLVRQAAGSLAGADDLAGQLGADSTALHVWHSVIDVSAASLVNLRVRLSPKGENSLPVVGRGAGVTGSSLVVIPHGGAVLRFSDPRLGFEILVRPEDGLGAVEVSRGILLAFAEQVEDFARTGMLAGL